MTVYICCDIYTVKLYLRRQVEFKFGGKTLIGIEQNPDTKSNWARMARDGMKVMQFIHEGKYIAVVTAGKVILYRKRTGRTD
jgi:hypothetical protein